MSYLDSGFNEGQWKGWYLSEDSCSVIRLKESGLDTLCPRKASVDYRIFRTGSGEPEYSGIHCFPKDGTVHSLHSEIGSEADSFRFGYKMCGLDCAMADCFELAYLESDSDELEKANRLIESHFS